MADENGGGALSPEMARAKGQTLRLTGQIIDLVEPDRLAKPLLPTPLAGDGKGSRNATANRSEPEKAHGGQTLTDVFVAPVEPKNLLPTPNTMDHLPPRSAEKIAESRGRSAGGYANVRETVVNDLLPTPVASEGVKAPAQQSAETKAKTGQVWLSNHAKDMETSWGKFEPAIRRWEAVTGRKAPAPTKPDGKDGQHRLSSEFTEWMMGLDAGWVTGVGLSRNDELKACGNGVVPQQALLALSVLFDGFELEREREL